MILAPARSDGKLSLPKLVYWSIRKNRGNASHLLAAFASTLPNLLRILLWTRLRRTVVIVLVEHMGDIVMAEPIARHARATNPGRPIIWVTGRPFAALPASFAAVDRVLTVGCVTDWVLLAPLLPWLTVWNLHIDGHCCPRCAIPLPNRTGRGVTHSNYYEIGNLTQVQCRNAGLLPIADPPVLAPSAAAAAIPALGLPPRYAVIHAKSNQDNRDWTPGSWRRLVGLLRERFGLPVIEVGLLPVATQHDSPDARSLCGQLSILQTAEVIRGAALFIGIDSGPAHLANAVGAPGIIIMGSYGGFDGHMPFSGGYASGATGTIVRSAGPAAEVPLQAVLDAVGHRLGIPHATGEARP